MVRSIYSDPEAVIDVRGGIHFSGSHSFLSEALQTLWDDCRSITLPPGTIFHASGPRWSRMEARRSRGDGRRSDRTHQDAGDAATKLTSQYLTFPQQFRSWCVSYAEITRRNVTRHACHTCPAGFGGGAIFITSGALVSIQSCVFSGNRYLF